MSRRRILGESWFWIVAGGLTLLVILAVIFAVRWASADERGQLQAREQINSGATRIAAYDHFFDLCAAIQAQEGILDAQRAELKDAAADDAERLKTNITGLLAQRARSVAQYNADARKSYTIGQFRASDLPYELPATYTEGEHTSCAV